MEQLLEARELIIGYYKRYETIIVLVIKFIVGAVIFTLIGGIDRSMPMLEKIASTAGSIPYIILMSLIFAVTPVNAGYLLITLNTCLQTSAMLEVALVLGVFMLAVQGLYTRLAPTECILILAMMAAYYFKLPYLVPIVAGLYFSLTSVIPIAIATFIWQFLPVVLSMFKTGSDTVLSVGGLTDAYTSAYTQLVGAVTANNDWIIMSFIFSMVVFVVYAVSRSSINYSKDIAIGLGGGMTIIGFLIAAIMTNLKIGILGMLLSSVISVGFAYVIRFFDVVLDYQNVERVQFQDEENVYYVKIVPKIISTGAKVHAEDRLVRTERAAEYTRPERAHPEPAHYERTRPEKERSHHERSRVRPEDERASERRATWSDRWEQIERERQEQEGGR